MRVMVLDAGNSIMRRMMVGAIWLEAPQVGDKPVRSSDLPKGEIRRDHSMSEKGQTGKPFTRVVSQGLSDTGKAKLPEV